MAISKIVVVSHSPLFCRAIAALIRQTTEHITVCCSPSQATSKIREARPSKIIVEIPQTDFAALNLLHKIHKQYRHIKIIIITDIVAPAFFSQLFKIKIVACLSKYCSPIDLKTALELQEEKKTFLDSQISSLTQAMNNKKLSKIKSLTRQEFQIVVMLAHGIRTQEIAKQLHLSIKTISSYHTQILNKLNLEHNIEIVKFIHQHQLLFLPMRSFPFFS